MSPKNFPSESNLDSRIESLATQVLLIRWNQFSDPNQRLQAIHYFEAESQKLQELLPDLKQRLQKAIRKIKLSEQERITRKEEAEKDKGDFNEGVIENKNSMKLAKKMIFHEIPPGEFMMGEVGAYLVKTEITKPFAMMETQVTQMMYSRLMIAMGERDPDRINPSQSKAGTDSIAVKIDGIDVTMKPDHPVEKVSWNDLMESGGFIAGLNKLSNSNDTKDQKLLRELIPGHKRGDVYDLPSEAQWEFVMSDLGRADKKYFDRNDDAEVLQHGWFTSNSGGKTHAVATKNARTIDGKPFYDLEGNVGELTKDSCDRSIKLPGGKDPLGAVGDNRIIRGGGMLTFSSLGSRYRFIWWPELSSANVGFRLVRSRP